MTNPLSPEELAACHQRFVQRYALRMHDELQAETSITTPMQRYEAGFADALDYLRAELAKEEPVAWRTIREGGIPLTDWIEGSGAGVTPAWPNCWIQKAYLRPSEPSQSTPSAESAPLCGAPAVGGPCVLPEGHNMGNLDIPSRYQAAPATPPSESAPIPEARVIDERESVENVLSLVESYGPWGTDINNNFRNQIILADEVKRLRGLYLMAVKGRSEMRQGLRDARTANKASTLSGERVRSILLANTHPLQDTYTAFTNAEEFENAVRLIAREAAGGKP